MLEVLDAHADRLETLTSEQPHVASMVLRLVAETYFRLGQFERSERILRRSIKLHRESDWGDQTYLIAALRDLGASLRMQARYDEAVAAIEESVEFVRSLHAQGATHYDLAASINDLGVVLLARGDHHAAAAACGEAVRIRAELGDTESAAVGIMLANLAWAESHLDDLDRAESTARGALELCVRHRGETSQPALQAMSHLGTTLAPRWRGAVRTMRRWHSRRRR